MCCFPGFSGCVDPKGSPLDMYSSFQQENFSEGSGLEVDERACRNINGSSRGCRYTLEGCICEELSKAVCCGKVKSSTEIESNEESRTFPIRTFNSKVHESSGGLSKTYGSSGMRSGGRMGSLSSFTQEHNSFASTPARRNQELHGQTSKQAGGNGGPGRTGGSSSYRSGNSQGSLKSGEGGGSVLRYALHLRFMCPPLRTPGKEKAASEQSFSGQSTPPCAVKALDAEDRRRFYIYGDLRVVFPQRQSDADEGKVHFLYFITFPT